MMISGCSQSVFRFNLRASIKEPTPKATPTIPIPFPSLKHFAKTAIILTATTAALLKPTHFPARAHQPPPPPTSTTSQSSPLSELLASNPDALDATKTLLQEKLHSGDEDAAAIPLLRRLADADTSSGDQWRFLLARVLAETGDHEAARRVFDEILESEPLSFEALFENALLMDRAGEGEAALRRLEGALRAAEDGGLVREARDVRLVIAQLRFLQKNTDEAMRIYDELIQEDPADFRPYFCRGMIFSLSDRNVEAREQFAKFRDLSPKKFEVEGFLRTPLSRMKLFGTDDEN